MGWGWGFVQPDASTHVGNAGLERDLVVLGGDKETVRQSAPILYALPMTKKKKKKVSDSAVVIVSSHQLMPKINF